MKSINIIIIGFVFICIILFAFALSDPTDKKTCSSEHNFISITTCQIIAGQTIVIQLHNLTLLTVYIFLNEQSNAIFVDKDPYYYYTNIPDSITGLVTINLFIGEELIDSLVLHVIDTSV